MRRSVVIGWLLALTLLLPVAESAAQREENLSSSQALRRAAELYEAGRTEEALSRFRGFIVRYAGSPLVPEAYLYLARIFRDGGQYKEALLYIERIPAERKGNEARLIEGASLVGAGEAERGVEILQGLEGADLRDGDRRLRFGALAEGNEQLGRPLPALFFLYRALSVAGPRQAEELLHRAHILLRDRLTEGELEEAAFMFAGSPIGEDARLQRALRAFARGDRHRAHALAQEIVRSPVPFPYRRDALLLLERLTGQGGTERTVSVMLPLSGRYGAFGTLVRRGMELALQVHHDSDVQLEFVDIEADPEKSVQTVAETTARPPVLAMVGPLTGGAAVSAAARAQRERIPLLSLSQRDGIPETGDYVFRLSLTARAQIRTLVQHVVESQGITTFAVLHPENRLGQEMTELFTREVERRGAKVVARQSYPEAATDFKGQVRRLRGLPPDGPEPPPEELPPVPFEALFIPDFADRIALVAPQVAYYGVTNVQLLGINGWNSPELTRLARSFVEGALFVDGFFKGSLDPVVSEFVQLYQEKYEEEPTILEAQGFDAANILLALLSNPVVRTREDVRNALSRLEEFPTVSGKTSFDEYGDAQRSLFLLQIRNGSITQIN